jgi:3-methyladenine DNA glycosylase AlkD
MTLKEVKKELLSQKSPKMAKLLMGFFKTGKGEYGEGDVFYGIKVPKTRIVAKKYAKSMTLLEIEELLHSKIHEERLCALLILIQKYENKEITQNEKKEIFDLYLSNTKYINNWDLVDLSAPRISGKYIFENPNEKKVLKKLAKSNLLWDKRIAILSTFYFISKNEFSESLKLAETLLLEEHDLMHKAIGWMLREIGKRDLKTEEDFLKKYYKKMPRTMLRYAIEKFPEEKRQKYLKGLV